MFHHTALAVKDIPAAHEFYTKAMGFELVKVVKRMSPDGGWAKHIFYHIGGGQYFAIWDLKGLEGQVVDDADWQGGISTGMGLPFWINHIAFDCKDIGGLERCKQRWLDLGHDVVEIKHEFIHSIYTRDPDGTLVEFTYDTAELTEQDRLEALELLADDSPATVPEYEGIFHRSPHRKKKRPPEDLQQAAGAL